MWEVAPSTTYPVKQQHQHGLLDLVLRRCAAKGKGVGRWGPGDGQIAMTAGGGGRAR